MWYLCKLENFHLYLGGICPAWIKSILQCQTHHIKLYISVQFSYNHMCSIQCTVGCAWIFKVYFQILPVITAPAYVFSKPAFYSIYSRGRFSRSPQYIDHILFVLPSAQFWPVLSCGEPRHCSSLLISPVLMTGGVGAGRCTSYPSSAIGYHPADQRWCCQFTLLSSPKLWLILSTLTRCIAANGNILYCVSWVTWTGARTWALRPFCDPGKSRLPGAALLLTNVWTREVTVLSLAKWHRHLELSCRPSFFHRPGESAGSTDKWLNSQRWLYWPQRWLYWP